MSAIFIRYLEISLQKFSATSLLFQQRLPAIQQVSVIQNLLQEFVPLSYSLHFMFLRDLSVHIC